MKPAHSSMKPATTPTAMSKQMRWAVAYIIGRDSPGKDRDQAFYDAISERSRLQALNGHR